MPSSKVSLQVTESVSTIKHDSAVRWELNTRVIVIYRLPRTPSSLNVLAEKQKAQAVLIMSSQVVASITTVLSSPLSGTNVKYQPIKASDVPSSIPHVSCVNKIIHPDNHPSCSFSCVQGPEWVTFQLGPG